MRVTRALVPTAALLAIALSSAPDPSAVAHGVAARATRHHSTHQQRAPRRVLASKARARHLAHLTPLADDVMRRLARRARRIHDRHPKRASAWVVLQRLGARWRTAHDRPHADDVVGAISAAARRYGLSAGGMIRVAQCESGLRRDAANGEYLGLFQLGGSARAAYLDGDWRDAYANALAAARYATDAGGWSPWSCGGAY